MNQQQIENENIAYLSYHHDIKMTQLEYFPEVMEQIPPQPKWDFSEKIIPPEGQSLNLLEYVNGEEMPYDIELRDNEFCIMMAKTCNFMEQMIVTKVIHTGKFYYKTQNDFKINPWWKFWN